MVILTTTPIMKEDETISQALRRITEEYRTHPEKLMRHVVESELDLQPNEIAIVVVSRDGCDDPLGAYVGMTRCRSEVEGLKKAGTDLISKVKSAGVDLGHIVARHVNGIDQSEKALWLYSIYAIHHASDAGMLTDQVEGIGVLLTESNAELFVL